MNKEINILPGFKPSPIGPIPKDWEVKELGNCCLIKGEYGINAASVEYSNNLPTYIRITDIDEDGNFISLNKTSLNNKDSEKYLLGEGDVLFARTGATVGKTYLYNLKDGALVFAGFLIRFRPNKVNLLPYFLKCFTNTKVYWDWVKKVSMRSGQPGINGVEYNGLKLPLPPLHEQIAIANCLSTWERAISATRGLIKQKELRKKWLMYQLLGGRKGIKRFVKNERIDKARLDELQADWGLKYIKSILSPIRNSFIPKKDELYQQIGIRSHTKGLFYKEKVTGAKLGDKRVFWVEPNCFIVNIVFAWEHAIAKTTEKEIGMIASHRFPMYKPKQGVLDLDYLLYYFKSPHGKHLLGLASPGGAGRNKTLGQSEFLKLQLPIPSLKEQISIAQVLRTADKEISLLKTKLYKLKEQKKGLIQQLLTGRKRFNMD